MAERISDNVLWIFPRVYILGILAYQAYDLFYYKSLATPICQAISSPNPCQAYMPGLESHVACSNVTHSQIFNIHRPKTQTLESSRKSINLWRKDAEGGDLLAMRAIRNLRDIAQLPTGEFQSIESQYETSLQRLIKELEQDVVKEPAQMTRLARLLKANKQEAKAIQWYRKSAEGGDLWSMGAVKEGLEKKIILDEEYEATRQKLIEALPKILGDKSIQARKEFDKDGIKWIELAGDYERAYEYDPNQTQWRDSALFCWKEAATLGSYRAMKYLREKQPILPDLEIINVAYKQGQDRVAQETVQDIMENAKEPVKYLREYLNIKADSFALENDSPRAFVSYIHAARLGNDEALKVLEHVNIKHPISEIETIRNLHNKVKAEEGFSKNMNLVLWGGFLGYVGAACAQIRLIRRKSLKADQPMLAAKE